MPKRSAGILLHRGHGEHREVFLVHPGGPFWAAKDDGAWSIPKGLVDQGEDPLATARREFKEETGFTAEGPFSSLGTFRQPGGKLLVIWAAEGDCDPSQLASNTFEIEWPPKSGRTKGFPEIDRGKWFRKSDALKKILKGQRAALEILFAE